jgi:hypothetical protein
MQFQAISARKRALDAHASTEVVLPFYLRALSHNVDAYLNFDVACLL